MLLTKILGTILLTAMVLATEEEPTEEKKVAVIEAIPVDDPQIYNSQVAQSRSANIGDDPPLDQLAVESARVVDRAVYAAPPRPQAIPVPLPLPVRPGSLVLPALPHSPRPKPTKGYPPAFAPPRPGYGGPPPPPPGYKRVSKPRPAHLPPPPPRNSYPPPAYKNPPGPVYKLPPPPPPAPHGGYNSPPPPPPPPQYNAPAPAPAPSPAYNAPPPAPALVAPAPAPGYGAPPPAPVQPGPNYGAPKPGDVYASPSEPVPAPAPAPGPSYNVPPPPPPAPTYNAPPPAAAAAISAPPPAPAPTYSQPPPPPAPTYSEPPPAPVASPQTGYGEPKQVDITASQPTAPIITSAPAPAPAPSEPIYIAPPVPAPAPASAPAPAPAPAVAAAQTYQENIPDQDVSGSATSYVAPESLAPAEPWPNTAPEMPKITSLDVKCEKNLMKVSIEFDKPFYGIVFSKGHYSNVNCVHLAAGQGTTSSVFDIAINSCGTTGNTENGLYGYGSQSGSGTFFENTVVVQYDPQVQEVWDQARKLRCTWHDQYEKSVTFRPFPVDMLDVVRADFAGDNVGCWMQIQVGKGPWASEVSGLVKIGQTMTMVLAIKDDDNKFDMLIRNCMAHDGKRAPIQLVDQKGCVTRPKLMSRFSKIKNFGASASVLSYAHFQAFKFPDSMEVHFQCTIQICRYQCPEQCSDESAQIPEGSYETPVVAGKRVKREAAVGEESKAQQEQDIVGVSRIMQVVSTRDLELIFDKETGETKEIKETETEKFIAPLVEDQTGMICMSTPGFAATLIVLLAILIVSCLLSAFLCLRFRGPHGDTRAIMSAQYDNPAFLHKRGHF